MALYLGSSKAKVSLDGFDRGVEEGKTIGYAEGKTDGIAEGRQAQYDEFWDKYQWNGTRTNYQYGAFGGFGWTDETYKPKYPLKPKHAYQMYCGCRLTEILNVDTSDAQSIGQMFYVCETVKRIGVISTISVTTSSGFVNTFALCSKLQTIDKLILKDSIIFNGSFNNCASLENLTIEGTIGQNGFNVQWSTKLSKASITSIINALSTTTSGLTVTLSKTAVNNAFETSVGAGDGNTSTEWLALIATKSNWTISLV